MTKDRYDEVVETVLSLAAECQIRANGCEIPDWNVWHTLSTRLYTAVATATGGDLTPEQMDRADARAIGAVGFGEAA